jgi:hypothetical protein
MSSVPIRIDGVGTRKSGTEDLSVTAAELVNSANPARFVRMFASETIAKGDAVCIDFAVSTYGLGNNVKLALVGAELTKQAVGLAAESITITGTDYQLIKIQVQGLCTFADMDDTNDDPGDMLGAGATGGRLTQLVQPNTGVGILVTEGTPGSNNTTVYLLNPASL